MNTDTGMTLEYARGMGELLAETLSPACSRVKIAGSIRRKNPSPNDIELVCKPETITAYGTRYNRLSDLCAKLLRDGTLEKRPDKNGNHAWGERAKRGIFYNGEDYAPCDIFSVIEPAQWGVIYAIRTGPWDFNRWLVTNERFGGACPADLKVAGGQVWYIGDSPNAYQLAAMPSNKFLGIAEANGCRTRPTPTEKDFFNTMGVPHFSPGERTKDRLMAYVRNRPDLTVEEMWSVATARNTKEQVTCR